MKDNQIFLQNDDNVLRLRDNAKKIAFQNAFFILTKKILEPEEQRKLDRIGEIDIESLIKDFKIVEEKITDINYSSNISVNFNSEKTLKFFEELKIKSKVLVSEEYLLFPIFKKFNTLYLWENDNIWYNSLRDEYDELGLLKLFFPDKNHINKLKISAEQVLNKDIDSINNFLKIYDKKKAIILYMEERYDLSLNELESKVYAQLFSNNNFQNIKLFQKDDYLERTEFSNTKLISKLIINELQDWWKNQIEIINVESEDESTFFLVLDALDLKKNIFIEKRFNEILGDKGFYLHEFDNESIIYKIQTKYSLDQLNLALEVDNYKLMKSTKYEDNFLRLQSY